jgi:hypothetical protein
MKFILIAILFLVPFSVRADEQRRISVFTSANDRYELRNTSGDEWSLREKPAKKELYRLKEKNLSSMTILIGDDGKSIVAIDDFSEQDFEKNPEVLIFYQSGEKIKSYKLSELLDNPKFISVSVSHFHWLYRNENSFSLKDSKLELTTFELNRYIFDAESGGVLKKEKDEILSGDAVYVYGEVKNLSGDKYEIDVKCAIYGSVSKGAKLQFASKELGWKDGKFHETLIIKNGKLAARKGIIFNVCN